MRSVRDGTHDSAMTLKGTWNFSAGISLSRISPRTIRDHFASHYLTDHLREPLARVPESAAEIISGEYNGNVFYTLAEEVRSRGMLQVAAHPDSPKLWDEHATENDIRAAAIRLYGYRPVRDAFDRFANNVLVTIVKSIPHSTEAFTPANIMNFDEMRAPLFVEERYSYSGIWKVNSRSRSLKLCKGSNWLRRGAWSII